MSGASDVAIRASGVAIRSEHFVAKTSKLFVANKSEHFVAKQSEHFVAKKSVQLLLPCQVNAERGELRDVPRLPEGKKFSFPHCRTRLVRARANTFYFFEAQGQA